MAKSIIEEKFQGSITAQNIQDGAKFIINIPL